MPCAQETPGAIVSGMEIGATIRQMAMVQPNGKKIHNFVHGWILKEASWILRTVEMFFDVSFFDAALELIRKGDFVACNWVLEWKGTEMSIVFFFAPFIASRLCWGNFSR